MDGEAKRIYSAGKYELTSKNRPGLKHVVALFSGGELANHCEVYFINKVLFSNILWITSSTDIQDQTMENYFPFQAQGYFTVRVSNAYDLFEIIGNESYLTVDGLKEFFTLRIASVAKEVLSIAMNQKGLSYGEINSHLTSLSRDAMNMVKPYFEKVGLLLEEFRFESVNMDKDAEFDRQREHLGNRSGDKIESSNYDKRRMYGIMETQAANQGGSGAVASAVSGMGFGVGMGQVYGGMVGNAMNSAFGGQQMYGGSTNNIQNNTAGMVQPHPVESMSANGSVCRNCRKPLQSDWKCCPYCGTSTVVEQTCPKCGQVLPDGAMFCPTCSAKLN